MSGVWFQDLYLFCILYAYIFFVMFVCVCVCVCVGFVMCGCFGNMYTVL